MKVQYLFVPDAVTLTVEKKTEEKATYCSSDDIGLRYEFVVKAFQSHSKRKVFFKLYVFVPRAPLELLKVPEPLLQQEVSFTELKRSRIIAKWALLRAARQIDTELPNHLLHSHELLLCCYYIYLYYFNTLQVAC